MAVKRRVVWLDDDEWARLGILAQNAGLTISAYIRFTALSGIDDFTREAPEGWATVNSGTQWPTEVEFANGDKLNLATGERRPLTQAERDAILRRVNKG